MKNKVFSPKLYLELFRQTKTIGIITTILSFIFSAFPISTQAIYYFSLPEDDRPYISVAKINEVNFFLGSMIICSLAALLLVFHLFSHLNIRKASDFYHCIPVSRNCYFITAISVIFTWCGFGVMLSSLTALISYAITPMYVLEASVFWNSIFVCFALMLLISGCASLALSLSGTKISNIILFLLIMFGPRIIITMITSLVSEITLVGGIDIFLFSENYYNIVFGTIQFIFFGEYNSDIIFANPASMIYTAVLGLIYLIISFFVMKYRKSELAENAAPNKYIRHVYSVLIAFMVSILFTNFLLNEMYHITDSGYTGVILTIYAFITIAVFFIFEGIFSKSIKKSFCSAPAFIAVIILNIVLTLSVMGLSDSILSYAPSADEIESISFNINQSQGYYQYDYITAKVSGTSVSDDELNELFAKKYKEFIDITREDPYFHTNYDNPCAYNYVTDTTFMTIKLKNGQTLKRRFSTSELETLYIKKAIETYGKNIEVPADYEIENIYIDLYQMGISYDILSENDLKDLWKTFKEEFEGLSDKKKLQISAIDENTDDIGTIYTYIYIYGDVNNISYYQQYYITDDTPETFKKIFELVQKYDNSAKFNDILNGNLNTYEIKLDTLYDPDSILPLNEYSDCYFFNRVDDGKLSSNVEVIYTDENASVSVENIKEAIKLAVDNSGKAIDFSKPVFVMYIDTNDLFDYNWSKNNCYSLIFQLSDEDTKTIKELLPIIETYYYNDI